jgi:hypothetical protein
MNIPPEFTGRVYQTRCNGLLIDTRKLLEMLKEWPGSEVDVVFEKAPGSPTPVVVIVFETAEDNTAFTLKHGYKYV